MSEVAAALSIVALALIVNNLSVCVCSGLQLMYVPCHCSHKRYFVLFLLPLFLLFFYLLSLSHHPPPVFFQLLSVQLSMWFIIGLLYYQSVRQVYAQLNRWIWCVLY